ncbi:hypothetical protein PFTANZ_06321 [Plasmodium falciparum Tanzania (2000708)]|uniref:Uncharacterized protein n=1 Tax=Plasmodium falciparum Tanzania (2000708) TaxID=1036725 RepID=A0A024VW88_PLAFA|nr:hypothetical protein PFTANZ_06321 [Plasmodium falciparum Tanzania (2000708)]
MNLQQLMYANLSIYMILMLLVVTVGSTHVLADNQCDFLIQKEQNVIGVE